MIESSNNTMWIKFECFWIFNDFEKINVLKKKFLVSSSYTRNAEFTSNLLKF